MVVKKSLLLVIVAGFGTVALIAGWIFRGVLFPSTPAVESPSEHFVARKLPSPIAFSGGKEELSSDEHSWDSEGAASAVSRQLDVAATAIASNKLEMLNGIQAPSFSAVFTILNTANTLQVGEGVSVLRIGESSAAENSSCDRLDEFFRQLSPKVAKDGMIRAKFKVVGVASEADAIHTDVRFELSQSNQAAAVQQVCQLQCQWLRQSSDSAPKLDKVTLIRLERTILHGGKLFEDCTRSVFSDNSSYEQQVVPGIPYWLSRIPKEFLGQFGHHGMSVADVNGDGLDDVYVCDAGGLPNRLYVQKRDGTVVDTSREAGVDILDDSVGCLLVDLDNDGDQDLAVGTDPFLRVFSNDGSGKFTLATNIEVETDSFSLSAADFDVDGDLDIYVCGYDVRKDSATDRGLPFPIPYHDANNGGKNALLRNDGDLKFSNVTEQVGLSENNSRFSMAAAWDDFDNDGDVDLYVANDFGRNNLYRNDDGRFVDVAGEANVEDHASGMSVSFGDYNRDGNMDVYVGNMFSSAGNRVTYQRKFTDGVAAATAAKLQRMARGNTLFSNLGDGTFHDDTITRNVAMGRWAWGSVFADITNSGWEDLIVANGYVTNEDSSDL